MGEDLERLGQVGQGPLLPVIPALNTAVHDALGIWIDEVPVTPEKVLRALESKAKGDLPRYGPKSFPTIEYRDPMFILPPWEGGDGRSSAQPEYTRKGL